jgi:hypothetical protein
MQRRGRGARIIVGCGAKWNPPEEAFSLGRDGDQVGAFEDWLKVNWAIAVTAIATAATALLIWFDRHDRKIKELPFVECALRPAKEAPAGWVRLDIVVRNFNPYAIHIVELRIKSPRSSALFTDWEAYKNSSGIHPATKEFIATNASPRPRAKIDKEISPVGTFVTGPIMAGKIDSIHRHFYYSPGAGRSGHIKVKMALVWEIRSRDVRTKEIPINRTITL